MGYPTFPYSHWIRWGYNPRMKGSETNTEWLSCLPSRTMSIWKVTLSFLDIQDTSAGQKTWRETQIANNRKEDERNRIQQWRWKFLLAIELLNLVPSKESTQTALLKFFLNIINKTFFLIFCFINGSHFLRNWIPDIDHWF